MTNDEAQTRGNSTFVLGHYFVNRASSFEIDSQATREYSDKRLETDLEALDDVKLRTIAANVGSRLARAGAASARLAQHEASLSPYHLTTRHAGRARGRSRSPGRGPAARK